MKYSAGIVSDQIHLGTYLAESSVAYTRLLADMNISPETVDALQQRGWDVIQVSQVWPLDASGDEILGFARRRLYNTAP